MRLPTRRSHSDRGSSRRSVRLRDRVWPWGPTSPTPRPAKGGVALQPHPTFAVERITILLAVSALNSQSRVALPAQMFPPLVWVAAGMVELMHGSFALELNVGCASLRAANGEAR